MTYNTCKDIKITEAGGYTIIKVPKQQAVPTIQIGDVRFDEFVGMMEDDKEAAGKSPVAIEDSAYEIWRSHVD